MVLASNRITNANYSGVVIYFGLLQEVRIHKSIFDVMDEACFMSADADSVRNKLCKTGGL